MTSRGLWLAWRWRQMLWFLSLWGWGSGQLRYSVPEESQPGTFVGNVARDLGLDPAAVSGLRLGSDSSARYFRLHLVTGELTVNEKVDRERLCSSSPSCALPLEVLVENPLQMFRLETEILDINDHSPSFLSTGRVLRIAEGSTVGSRFPLESAQDPDVGTNSVTSYQLNENQHFSLSVKKRADGRLLPELVLEKSLDREEESEHQLILTALDGGRPKRSGTTQITVVVLDSNDNAPSFDQSLYMVSLLENTPVNTLLMKLNATDMDEGLNGEIEYSFEDHSLKLVEKLFSLDPLTGEILVQQAVDFEEAAFYEMSVRVRDKGSPELEGHCVIQVKIVDVNDNAPEILITSVVNLIAEDTPVGTTVGLLSIRDRDSGKNGEVHLDISPSLPFSCKHVQNHFSLVTAAILDREQISQYTIQLVATDLGQPPMRTQKTIILNISDVNDNPPHFSHPVINAFVKENHEPGSLLCTVSASDPDEGENSQLTYSIIDSSAASTLIYINSQTGTLYAQRSLDYETVQVLPILVQVEDAGSPKLSANITVFIFVLDQNDNTPSILYPASSKEVPTRLPIPRSISAGSMVTKVAAVDADSGHNAWLSYSLHRATDPLLFSIAKYSGEIRIGQGFKDTDASQQELVILVKDHGEPALSSTATILLSIEDHLAEERPKSGEFLTLSRDTPDLTLYLIIALVAISILALVTFVVLTVKCIKKGRGYSSSVCSGPTYSDSWSFPEKSRPTFQLSPDGTLAYTEFPKHSLNPYFRTYLSTGSEDSFLRPRELLETKRMAATSEQLLSGRGGLGESKQQAQPFQQSQPFQQAPTNTDWRFSAAQRPGTSGSQNSEEAGGWPNNQFETERLQAMILASANEGADGSSTLGGAGTMGLSARYGPQFTLQHVPDYRQNVYIPGSTATLTNAAGKRDGKAAASGANKKKSGKKEKK